MRPLCIAMGILTLAFTLTSCAPPPPKADGPAIPRSATLGPPNELAVGPQAVVKEPMVVPFSGTMDLNFKTREEIFNTRRNMALRSDLGKLLVNGNYAPSGIVFDGLRDEKQWVSMRGKTFFGWGQPEYVDGQAAESRFICTPYLLVSPDFKIEGSVDEWRFGQGRLANSQFPQQCPPKKIVMDPANATEEITYDISTYRNDANAYYQVPSGVHKISFTLVAYNAKDFGYNYLYVKPEQTTGVKKTPRLLPTFSEIKQVLGGKEINGMTGDTDDFQKFGLTSVPSKMTILLWKGRPADVNQKPDFTVLLKFE